MNYENGVQIGHWALFKCDKEKLLGQIISVSNLKGIKFYEEIAPINKSLRVLCSWFKIESSGSITPVSMIKHVHIKNYIISTPSPSVNQNELYFEEDIMKKILNYIT